MRLGVYYHTIFLRRNGRYFCDGGVARLFDEIARRVTRLIIFAPVTTIRTRGQDAPLDIANLDVVELPFYDSFLRSLPQAVRIHQIVRRAIRRCDMAWLRSGPLDFLFYQSARPRPVFFEIVGDVRGWAQVQPRYRGPMRLPGQVLLAAQCRLTQRLTERTLTFVTGSELFRRHAARALALRQVVASTLTDANFHMRTDTCRGPRIRLLFVGWFMHVKGLGFLLEALAMVRRRRPQVEIHLVGEGACEAELRAQAASRGIARAVHFDGFASGAVLDRQYRDADIFVLPSLTEGTPRVLLEAMAAGLPLVATRIGGIPDMVTDGANGLLVPAADPSALANAIERLVADAGLRRRLIRAGYRYARRHTVADFVDGVLEDARTYYGPQSVPTSSSRLTWS